MAGPALLNSDALPLLLFLLGTFFCDVEDSLRNDDDDDDDMAL